MTDFTRIFVIIITIVVILSIHAKAIDNFDQKLYEELNDDSLGFINGNYNSSTEYGVVNIDTLC